MSLSTASCCCGQLKLSYEEEIEKSSICHCYACQKRTGSVFGIQGRLKKDKVTITGKASCYTRIGDGGCKIEYGFCPTCGTTVYWTIDYPDFKDSISLALGTVDNHKIPAPTFSVYEDRLYPWIKLPESITEHMS